MPEATGRGLTAGFSWVLIGNVLYMASAALLVLVLPRVVSVAEFGMWQLYQLYVVYFGYVTFGYTDGVYLRLGGRSYARLPSRRLAGGLVQLIVLDLASLAALVVLVAGSDQGDKGLLIVLAGAAALFYVPRTLVTVVLQVTGRPRAFALATVTERLVMVAGVGLALLVGLHDIGLFIACDLLGKVVGLVVALVVARSAFLVRPDLSGASVREFLADCGAGTFVLVANLAAVLINGVVRLAIEDHWGIEMFGQVSLAFQFTTMFMVLVNSVSISVYPHLRNLGLAEYGRAYAALRSRFVTPLVLSLGLYFPLAWALRLWIPAYEQAVFFLALLFPLSVYETKSRGLSVVFLKALRKEKVMAVISVGCLGLVVVFTWGAVYVWQNVTAAVFLIAVVSAVRSVTSEVVVHRLTGVPILVDTVTELLVCAVFLGVVAAQGPPISLLALYLTLAVYGAAHRDALPAVPAVLRGRAAGGADEAP